jgi:hypothetical protein
MLHIRVVKTRGNSRSVQVYRYRNSRRVIIKHVGCGKTKEEISALEEMAKVFIADYTKQSSLFEKSNPNELSAYFSKIKAYRCTSSPNFSLYRISNIISYYDLIYGFSCIKTK